MLSAREKQYLTMALRESVQVRSYFWPVFSCITRKKGTEITPHLDTFHAVWLITYVCLSGG